MPSVLLVSPHPDDEVLGLGGTVAMFVRSGWAVTNFACSLGRASDHDRRRSELRRAAERLGIATVVADPPASISAFDDLAAAQARLVDVISQQLAAEVPDIVMSPSLHDIHHGHETVARAVLPALEAQGQARWWQYAVWGDLPFPSLYIPLDPRDTEAALYALGSYTGEHRRNDYRDLLSGGWIRNRALGAEKVFGFGAARPQEARAVELAAEWVWDGTTWWWGSARVVDPDSALAPPSARNARPFLDAPSVSALRPELPSAGPTA